MNTDALKAFFLNKTNIRILAALVLAIVIAVIVISSGWYYVATVNGTPITARAFFKNYRASTISADTLSKMYAERAQNQFGSGDSATSTPAIMSDAEIKTSVLMGLIERALIRDGARAEAGSGLDALVREKVSKYENDATLKNAAQTLYGFTPEEYQAEILMPQAEQDILAGRLFLKGQRLDAWLKEAKKSARVNIFSRDFSWDGEKVVYAK